MCLELFSQKNSKNIFIFVCLEQFLSQKKMEEYLHINIFRTIFSRNTKYVFMLVYLKVFR